MGLEVTGGGGGGDDGGGSLLDASGLAQKLEDEGTNEQNANILNLFLDSVTLPGGAPAPITNNVGSTEVTASSIVFNANFTRERYGRAAVQDPITLDSDKLSLLTDDNMTAVGKVLAICGALKFDAAVNALNLGTPSRFAELGKPSDIDDFSSRPESMYVNAGRIPGRARDGVMAAFRGDAESEFINAMVTQVGGDTAAFTTFNDIVSDQPLMESIATDSAAIGMLSAHPNGATVMAQSQTAMTEIVGSQTAMQNVAASQTAMQEVAVSQTAIQEVIASQTAIQEVAASSTAMQNVAASQTAMEEVAPSQTAMEEITSSQAAMQEVAASSTAMQEVAASSTAMQEVATSETAMQEVVSSETAMQEVANSAVSIDAFLTNTSTVETIMSNTLLNSNIAESEFETSELKQTKVVSNSNNENDRGGGTFTNRRSFSLGVKKDGGGGSIDISFGATGSKLDIINSGNVNRGTGQNKELDIVTS